jgi:hypothetical protein
MAQSDAPRQWPLASNPANEALRNWWNVEPNKAYIDRLTVAVMQLHYCGASWGNSVTVTEVFNGQTTWQGHVEVVNLTGHPKAKRAYGWSHADGEDDKDEKFVAVFEIPPVESAQTAVKVAILAEVKRKK